MAIEFKDRHSGNDLNIFSELAAQAEEYGAINLAQGSPDYAPDSRLTEFLQQAIHHDMNAYASACVLPLMQENLIRFSLSRPKPISVTEDEVTLVPGATYGMYVAFASFLEPGDEVIIIEPCYNTYVPAVEIRRAQPVFVQMPNSEIPWELIQQAITPRTKAIIVNSPNNPTGKVWDPTDWDLLWELIKDTDIIVISDEVYDLLCYDGHKFLSASHHPEIAQRCFCIYSFEKMFHIAGWKASYIIAPPEYTAAFRKIHQYLTFTVNAHAQFALGNFLQVFDVNQNRELFRAKRDLFCELFTGLPLEIIQKAEGGYFQTLSFCRETFPYSDREFAELLIREAKVACVPYSAFYHDGRDTGQLRFCFAKKDETLIRAAEQLKEFFAKNLSTETV